MLRYERKERFFVTFFEAVKTALTQYAVFSGRARRKEYWYFLLFNAIVGSIIGFLGAIMQKPKAMTLLSIVFTLAFLLPSIGVAVRRLHDTGRSGWWYLLAVPGFVLTQTSGLMVGSQRDLTQQGILSLVSLACSIPLIVFYCQDSQPGENRFGPNPKDGVAAGIAHRLLQAAVVHKPTYIYLDSAMTALDPAVTAAMQRVFPSCAGTEPLTGLLSALPQPILYGVDTDTLFVLLKYTTVCDPANGEPLIQSLQNAILRELAERGL